ncbi:MAG: preprotein translocase subunit SecG, partial [Rhodospirillaceae bacterium]|nr:preprotein translocase subunit SecG [Rhodospirillaceae bacterium]
METILLVILVIVALVMIGCVLVQRSEGGALGIG